MYNKSRSFPRSSSNLQSKHKQTSFRQTSSRQTSPRQTSLPTYGPSPKYKSQQKSSLKMKSTAKPFIPQFKMNINAVPFIPQQQIEIPERVQKDCSFLIDEFKVNKSGENDQSKIEKLLYCHKKKSNYHAHNKLYTKFVLYDDIPEYDKLHKLKFVPNYLLEIDLQEETLDSLVNKLVKKTLNPPPDQNGYYTNNNHGPPRNIVDINDAKYYSIYKRPETDWKIISLTTKYTYKKFMNLLTAYSLYVTSKKDSIWRFTSIYTNKEVEIPDDIGEILDDIKKFHSDMDSGMNKYYILTDEQSDLIGRYEINEEHVIPSSIYFKFFPMVTDLHNVFPIYKKVNSLRSNFSFSNINPSNSDDILYFTHNNEKHGTQVPKDEIKKEEYGIIQYRGFNSEHMMNVFQHKPEQYRCDFPSCLFNPIESENLGAIARSVLYFHYVYRLNPISNILPISFDRENIGEISEYYYSKFVYLYDKFLGKDQLKTIIKWHIMYDPTDQEKRRDNEIFKIQENKNPFMHESMEERIRHLQKIFNVTFINLYKFTPLKI